MYVLTSVKPSDSNAFCSAVILTRRPPILMPRRKAAYLTMKLLLFGQHRQDCLKTPLPRLRRLSGLQSPGNCIYIGSAQRLEEGLGSFVLGKFAPKITRHCHLAGRIVRGFPAAVLFGRVDLFEPCSAHVAGFCQALGVLSVSL